MPQLIPVAGLSREMAQSSSYTSGGAGDLGGTSTIVFIMQVTASRIRFFYTNYNNYSNAETTVGNTNITVSASFQAVADTGTPVALTFGGATSVVIQAGQSVYSDWLNLSTPLPVGQQVAARTFVQVANGAGFPTGLATTPGSSAINGVTASTGGNYVQYTNIPGNANGSNQLLTAGTTTSWSSTGGVSHVYYGPQTIEGYALDGQVRPVVILVGDSILSGVGELNDSTGGFAVRGLMAIGQPYYMAARSNEKCSNIVGMGNFAQRMNRVRRSTTILYHYGTNDISGNILSYAAFQAETLLAWQMLTLDGQALIPMTLLPRPSYTTATFPTTNQTPNTGNAVYQQYNAWLRAPYSAGAGVSARFDAAQLGIFIPGIIDCASYIETDVTNATPGGPSAPNTGGYWYCGPGNAVQTTTDCIHANTAGQLYLVSCMTSLATVNLLNSTVVTPTHRSSWPA